MKEIDLEFAERGNGGVSRANTLLSKHEPVRSDQVKDNVSILVKEDSLYYSWRKRKEAEARAKRARVTQSAEKSSRQCCED